MDRRITLLKENINNLKRLVDTDHPDIQKIKYWVNKNYKKIRKAMLRGTNTFEYQATQYNTPTGFSYEDNLDDIKTEMSLNTIDGAIEALAVYKYFYYSLRKKTKEFTYNNESPKVSNKLSTALTKPIKKFINSNEGMALLKAQTTKTVPMNLRGIKSPSFKLATLVLMNHLGKDKHFQILSITEKVPKPNNFQMGIIYTD